MKTLVEFFTASWLQAIGYTLLHSFWQALIVGAVVLILLRYTDSRRSNLRYAFATGGLLLIVLISCITFSFYFFNNTSIPAVAITTTEINQHGHTPMVQKSPPINISSLIMYIEVYTRASIPFFLMAWLVGALIFLMRIVTGLFVVNKLRAEAVVLNNEWSTRIQELSKQLNVNRLVKLAESSALQVPVIVGFLKPLILIPVGMCTSLSTAQLEAIFVHEIMHIRRKDYLVNMLQSIVEAIYFFNPSVWLISSLIKQEREHCCDDAVIALHQNPIAYARALASLEEARFSKPGLVLSFAGNKNQLLNRIKRLMEKSAKNYSSTERVLPALLLIVGLICASWISTQTGGSAVAASNGTNAMVSDTTKKAKKNRAAMKRAAAAKTPVVSEEPVDEQTSIDKETETQDEFGSMLGFPPVPPVGVTIPDFPPMPEMGMIMMNDFDIPAFAWNNEKDWEEFGKEFEKNFSAKFEKFYEQHGEDIHKLIEEVNEKVNNNFDESWETKMQDFALKQEEWAKSYAEKWEQRAEEMAAHHEQNAHEHARKAEQHAKAFEKNHQRFEEQRKAFEKKNKQFEKALRDELIRDGYLEENEPLKNMHWHNGKIEINGEKIKADHEEKYNQLHKKYFTEIQPLEEVEEQ